MVELADSFDTPTAVESRALAQAARELLLAQSSDWAFIMKTGTMVPYAVRRTKEHVSRFNELYDGLKSRSVDVRRLEDMEWRDNPFQSLDYRVYRSRRA
jgi:1,4-alpha-glucan branching enzyme